MEYTGGRDRQAARAALITDVNTNQPSNSVKFPCFSREGQWSPCSKSSYITHVKQHSSTRCSVHIRTNLREIYNDLLRAKLLVNWSVTMTKAYQAHHAAMCTTDHTHRHVAMCTVDHTHRHAAMCTTDHTRRHVAMCTIDHTHRHAAMCTTDHTHRHQSVFLVTRFTAV